MSIAAWLVGALAAAGWGHAAWRARRRGVLVARACHEVRGPLTVIGLAAHAQAPTLAAVAAREVGRAALLLDDLALAPRGRRRPDEHGSVDVDGLLHEEAASWAAAAGPRVAVLPAKAGAAVVRGDRLQLGQITSNLIANAVEHGEGTVTVAARADDRRVRIDVADDGPGPPAATRPRRTPGGSRGHGLRIAADLARRHGGRLTRHTAADGRSVVTVDLPRAGTGR